MIKNITLINTSNNTTVNFDNTNFVLNSHTLDSLNMQHNKSKTTKQVGATITSTVVPSRIISLIGYVWASSTNTLDENKQTLVNLTTPWTDIIIQVTTDIKTYQLTTKTQNLVKWGAGWSNQNDQYVKFSINLLAPTTLWEATEPVTIPFSSFKNTFKFPFYSPTWGFTYGYPVPYSPVSITNPSPSPIGLIITLNTAASITGVSITNLITQQTFVLTNTLEPQTTLTISTIFGHKTVTATTNNVTTNLLGSVDLTSSVWLQLEPGENTFSLGCTSGDITNLSGSISYTPQYWGVV